MPSKKKYTYYICKNCEIDFLVSLNRKGKTYCPSCGESMYAESKTIIWIDRPLLYKKPWTEEEDGILIMGVECGYSWVEIGEALEGRTARACFDRWRRIGKGKCFT